MNRRMNKGGQFFLIAAVIIIIVAVSVITVSNYSQPRNSVRLYDFGEELGIESQNVLEYGTYSNLNETEMKELMQNFIATYVDYVGETGNLYFIFGNKNKIYAVGYQQGIAEDVCIKINPEGLSPTYCEPLKIGEIPETQEFLAGSGEISRVAVKLPDDEYQFRLKPGENFYFVIWQKVGEETHVITN